MLKTLKLELSDPSGFTVVRRVLGFRSIDGQLAAQHDLVGIDRKRFFSFDGKNRVTLRVEQPETAGVVASTLTWERLESVGSEK